MILDFVAIDFETASYSPHSACSVGLAEYRNGGKCRTFYSRIRPPQLYVRPDFTAIHGLTADDLRDAPSFDILWPEIRAFIGGLPLLAHNAAFDRSILQATLAWYGIECPPYRFYCSLQAARRAWPEGRHALTVLAGRFGIVYDAHNALADAETCARIFLLAQQETDAP